MENKKQPKYQALTTWLRQEIAAGTWHEGDVLPSESELCARANASRGTVRHALAQLRSEGLIAGGQGKPPIVAQQVQSQSFTTFMSFTDWARSIGLEAGQDTRELAQRRPEAFVSERLELDEDAKVVQLLRLRLLDGSPAMLERTSFPQEVGRLLFDFDTDSGSIFEYLREQGVDLYRGKHTIDAVAADEVDAQLLGVPVGAPLLREQRVTSSKSGQKLEFSDDRYLPHLANFTIENTSEQRASLSRVRSIAG
ncbi:GntR family transcriptional regulator [Glutamicibacter sp. HZAU]|uniref:GntR family transcriptional regulator n=1 Tax=Glutamicibacter sp. HZAU TaxID=2049891 RepID=UPI000FFBDC66|nr:GntR family transcriptional regulator [Glutamicibacter sp. HZAU]RWZ84785.1 GntR family transcriptional regulator [Glutamicibacter sp. HZAU]